MDEVKQLSLGRPGGCWQFSDEKRQEDTGNSGKKEMETWDYFFKLVIGY